MEVRVFDGESRNTDRILKWGDKNDIGMTAEYAQGETCKHCGSYIPPKLRYASMSILTPDKGWLEVELGDSIVKSDEGTFAVRKAGAEQP